MVWTSGSWLLAKGDGAPTAALFCELVTLYLVLRGFGLLIVRAPVIRLLAFAAILVPFAFGSLRGDNEFIFTLVSFSNLESESTIDDCCFSCCCRFLLLSVLLVVTFPLNSDFMASANVSACWIRIPTASRLSPGTSSLLGSDLRYSINNSMDISLISSASLFRPICRSDTALSNPCSPKRTLASVSSLRFRFCCCCCCCCCCCLRISIPFRINLACSRSCWNRSTTNFSSARGTIFGFFMLSAFVCVLLFLLLPKEILFELFFGVVVFPFSELPIVVLELPPVRLEKGHGKPEEEDFSEHWLSSVLLALMTRSSIKSIFPYLRN
mmetsp:Transcript_9741/g.23590  ORF Transcript_9741/g.23590 Transcript_9741/m.23590 type:complete len:325 (+) Transcript_9741:1126-2100(+)